MRLEHLKAIRADLHTVKADIRDIKIRLLNDPAEADVDKLHLHLEVISLPGRMATPKSSTRPAS